MEHDGLNELIKARRWAHRRLLDRGSKAYGAFVEPEGATFGDGALGEKEQELIAMGISVRIDCESCMQWHIEQAASAGASYEEVLEAVEVGIETGSGPATVSARFVIKVMDAVYVDSARRAMWHRPRAVRARALGLADLYRGSGALWVQRLSGKGPWTRR